MAESVPFLKVYGISRTIEWYKVLALNAQLRVIYRSQAVSSIGQLEWEGAAFMLGADERQNFSDIKDTGLWFKVESVDKINAKE